MAVVDYDPTTLGGAQVAEDIRNLMAAIDKIKLDAAWVGQIGPAGLEGHPHFMVAGTQGQAFNDVFLTLSTNLQTFLSANGGENAGRIAMLYRGG